ncbi:MAG: SDR family NAD(P)-dependent oxidoreductase [Pseudomonadota bacterium]
MAKTALIVGASGGIGSALSTYLAEGGTEVTRLSRAADGLDVTDEASVEHVLGGLAGPFDLLFVATGALAIDGSPPEKSVKMVTPKSMADQFALNTIGPAMLGKHGLRLIHRDRRSVMAVLSARVGSIGDNALGGWLSYRTAKAALNQVVRTTAIELSRTRKHAICVALHPGTVATPFTQEYLSRYPSVPPEVAAANLTRVIDGLRVEDTGGFYDYSGKAVPW